MADSGEKTDFCSHDIAHIRPDMCNIAVFYPAILKTLTFKRVYYFPNT